MSIRDQDYGNQKCACFIEIERYQSLLATERGAWKKREAEIKEDLASAEDTIKLKESLIVLWKSKAERLAEALKTCHSDCLICEKGRLSCSTKEALSEFEWKKK